MATLDHLAAQTGRDHVLAVDRADARPLRVQLEEQLRDAIRAGRLHEGEALPATRALAAELGVARGVVVEAYAQLAAEGFVIARRGSATRVAAVGAVPAAPVAVPATAGPVVRFDLRVESAGLSLFPRRAWLASMRRVLHELPDAALGYGDRAGRDELRRTLAAYLGRSRGVVADPARIVVTTGMSQAIALLGRVLAARGVQEVAVEDPGFPVHRLVLERAGLRTVPVPVDARGLRVDALGRAGAVLLTPAHQMPTGAVLAPERRAALLEWAARRDAFVLEDDYDGEYRYERGRIGALQGLAPAHTVYLGSTSKTLAPALRLGWMVLPDALAAAVAEEKAWADGGSAALDQLAFADLIRCGALDRHLRRARLQFRRRRDILLAELAARLPSVEVAGAAAGLHVLATLPADADVNAVLGAAWARGVGVYGFEHGGRGHLALGYANCPEPSVVPAVRALAEAAGVVGVSGGVPL